MISFLNIGLDFLGMALGTGTPGGVPVVRVAYFLGGLLSRPPPDFSPVLLGQFGVLLLMVVLQNIPRKKGVRGPGAHLADACYKS